MGSLSKTYTFKGYLDPDVSRTFRFFLYMKYGGWGRAEPYDAVLDGPNTYHFMGSFSSSTYNIKEIVIDGKTIVYMNSPDNNMVSYFDSKDLSTGIVSVVLNSNFGTITDKSEASITLSSGNIQTPWISYDLFPMYNSNRNMGMIDWDVTPANIVQFMHNADFDFGGYNAGLRSLLAIALCGIAFLQLAQGIFLTSLGNDLTSRTYSKSTIFASLADSLSNSKQISEESVWTGLNKVPIPWAKFIYKNGWQLIEDINTVGAANLSPRIFTPTETWTLEFFLLKYQLYEDMYKFIETLAYPYMEYTEGMHVNGADGPRIDTYDRTIISESPSYRTEFFDVKTFVGDNGSSIDEVNRIYWFDRLVQLSKLAGSEIIRPQSNLSTPAPREYTDAGFKDEYLFLNSLIKINKVLKVHKTKVSVMRNLGSGSRCDYYDILWDEGSQEYKDMIDGLDHTFVDIIDKKNPVLDAVDSMVDILAEIKVSVVIEPNATGYTELLSESETYTIAGKLISPHWLKVSKGVNGQGSMLDETDLWQWLGISEATLNAIKSKVEWHTPYNWIIVVRGKFNPDCPEEIPFKYSNEDYVIKEVAVDPNNPPPEGDLCLPVKQIQSTPESDIVLSSDPTKLMPINSVCGYLEQSTANKNSNKALRPIKVFLQYLDSANDQPLPLAHTIIMPQNNMFHYIAGSALNCYCISESDLTPVNVPVNLVINFPEVGPAKKYAASNGGELMIPRLEIPLIQSTSQNGWLGFSDIYGFKVQFLRNDEVITSGFTPIVTGGKLTGFTVPYFSPKEANAPSYNLRLINTTQTTMMRPADPRYYGNKQNQIVKYGHLIKITAEGIEEGDKLHLSLNSHFGSTSTYNLEIVGVSRFSTVNDWYFEMVPGRGIKSLTGDHGVYFQNSQTLSVGDEGYAGRIQGQYLSPSIVVDAYDEQFVPANQTKQRREFNDVAYIRDGSELEILSTVPSLQNSNRIYAYTKTNLYELRKPALPRIDSFFDPTRNISMLTYNDSSNVIMLRKTYFDWAESYLFNQRMGDIMSSNSLIFSRINCTSQEKIFLGPMLGYATSDYTNVTRYPTTESGYSGYSGTIYYDMSTESIVASRGILAGGNIPYYDNNGVLQSESAISLGSYVTLKKDAKVVGLRIECNHGPSPEGMSDWYDTAVLKISFTNDVNTSLTDYGVDLSSDTIKPTLYYVKVNQLIMGKTGKSVIMCPVIENPKEIRVQYVVPSSITPNQISEYRNVLAQSFSITQVYVTTAPQMAGGTACTTYMNEYGELVSVYQGEKLYNNDGQLIEQTSYKELTYSQIASSTTDGECWKYPRMSNNTFVGISPDELAKDISILTRAGISSVQANYLVTQNRRWDKPMFVSTLSTPSISFDYSSKQLLHFGYTDAVGDVNKGHMVMWQPSQSLLGPKYTLYTQEENAKIAGELMKTSHDVSLATEGQKRIIALNVEKEVISIVLSESKQMLVFVRTQNGTVVVRCSNNDGVNWRESKVKLFNNNAYFKNAQSVFAVLDKKASTIAIFGLVLATDTEYHLYCYNLPQWFFFNDIPDSQVEACQDFIDTTPKILVVGNPNNIPATDLQVLADKTGPRTILGNVYKMQNGTYNNLPPYIRSGLLIPSQYARYRQGETTPAGWDYEKIPPMLDSNITFLHKGTGYYDQTGRMRVFYLKDAGKVIGKVSANNGYQWQTDFWI